MLQRDISHVLRGDPPIAERPPSILLQPKVVTLR